jgi:hypothetical protein
MDAPLPVAWPGGLDPNPSSGSTYPAFEAPPKLRQLAVVADELRQHFGADHSRMTTAVAAEPDVVSPHHGVAKGFRGPVAKFGRELDECDVPSWAS